RREFPEFLGAVSHVGMLGREGAVAALAERADRLSTLVGEDERRLGRALAAGGVPRLFVIEAEYSLAMLRAERDWVLSVVDEIKTGGLEWPTP
ncbi:MAG TPA: PadR family transcriptional regulator, partial [Candidatus Dormibacteraeota bacterium]|nr:PadR family transcriptional regulator [Candidatus Dormibacteraeota bacterium]